MEKSFLKDAIESVKKQISKNDEIVIVDDNSNDGSQQYIKKYYPNIILVENKKNLGGAEATTVGLKKTKGNYILILDNDIVLEEGAIKILKKTLDDNKKIGLVGGMVKDYGKSNFIQDMGMDMDIFGYGYSKEGSINGISKKDSEVDPNKIKKCFYISACMLMLKREVMDKIGYFDNKYFIYKDDLDFCWRARLAGYDIVSNPKAKIYHKMGVTQGGTSIKKNQKYQTTAKKRFFGEKNTIRTIIKNYKWHTLLWILPLYFLINILEIVFFLITLNFQVAWSYAQSWWWNLKNLPDTIRERKIIQKFRKTSDSELFRRMYIGSAKLKILFNIGLPKFK